MNERLDYLREKTYLLTTAPGVYQMKDKTGHIIYIGKAKICATVCHHILQRHPTTRPRWQKWWRMSMTMTLS